MRWTPRTALVVVDVQNDFADPAGSLSVRGGVDVVTAVNALVEEAVAAGAPVLYTQDWHPGDTPHFAKDGGMWPVHCVQGTWGAALHPDLHVRGDVVRKGEHGEDGYSGFTVRDPVSGQEVPTPLAGVLRDRGVEELVVAGLATDYCVRATALDGRAAGWPVTVPWHAVAAVDAAARGRRAHPGRARGGRSGHRVTGRSGGQDEAAFLASYDPAAFPPFAVTVDMVLLTVRHDVFSVLLVERDTHPFRGALALPGGFVQADEDLDAAAVRRLERETGVRRDAAHVEQLGAFGAPDRDPRMRVVSVAYLVFAPDLEAPSPGEGTRSVGWCAVDDVDTSALAFDHERVLAAGVERARAKLEYTSLAAAFVGESSPSASCAACTRRCGATRSTRATSTARSRGRPTSWCPSAGRPRSAPREVGPPRCSGADRRRRCVRRCCDRPDPHAAEPATSGEVTGSVVGREYRSG